MKSVKENDAIALIEFSKNANKEIIDTIDTIISKNYDVEFIIKLDKNHYKGDMGCLSFIAAENMDEITKRGLFKYIIKYDLFNPSTNEKEDWVKDYEYICN